MRLIVVKRFYFSFAFSLKSKNRKKKNLNRMIQFDEYIEFQSSFSIQVIYIRYKYFLSIWETWDRRNQRNMICALRILFSLRTVVTNDIFIVFVFLCAPKLIYWVANCRDHMELFTRSIGLELIYIFILSFYRLKLFSVNPSWYNFQF